MYYIKSKHIPLVLLLLTTTTPVCVFIISLFHYAYVCDSSIRDGLRQFKELGFLDSMCLCYYVLLCVLLYVLL